MEVLLSRLFHLKAGEVSLLLVLGFALFSNSLAQKVSEIASISNFLSNVGPPQFLIVLIISSIIGIVMTGLQSLLVDRFDRVLIVRYSSTGLAIAFILLRLMFLFQCPEWLSYGFFYLLSDLQIIFFPMAFWVLANDIFDITQSKRIFPLLASLGFIGNLAGIGITAISPFIFLRLSIKSEEILLVNILIYFLVSAVLELGLRQIRLRKTYRKPETMKETLSEGWNFVKDVPAFRLLTISIVATIVCETILEFHFYTVSEQAFQNASHYQTFLSLFTLARTLLYIAIQSFLTQRIIATMDLKNTFLIQPICSLVGSFVMLGVPSLIGGVTGLALQKLPQYTIDETARKAFQGLVPEERRGRVSLFMDSYLFAGGVIGGAIITGVFIIISRTTQGSWASYGYLGASVAASSVAIWAVFKVRQVYDSSLLNWRLKRRQRGKSVLDRLEF